jgi:hypothetical protein
MGSNQACPWNTLLWMVVVVVGVVAAVVGLPAEQVACRSDVRDVESSSRWWMYCEGAGSALCCLAYCAAEGCFCAAAACA